MALLQGDSATDVPKVLASALQTVRPALLVALLFSVVAMALGLASSLYVMNVFDRVLTTRNMGTLAALTLLLVLVLGVHACLMALREDVLRRASIAFDRALAPHLAPPAGAAERPVAAQGSAANAMDELDHLRAFMAGPGMMALMDAPWAPLLVLVCALLHPWIGLLVVVMGALVGLLTVAAERLARSARLHSADCTRRAESLLRESQRRDDSALVMGLPGALHRRWLAARDHAIGAQWQHGHRRRVPDTALRFVREGATAAAIGLGAILVAQDQITVGTLFAVSLLMAKAIQPVQALILNGPAILRAKAALARLAEALRLQDRAKLPGPGAEGPAALAATQLALQPPGREPDRWLLTGVTFVLPEGAVMAVIGPGGSGKTALLRTLAGLWPPAFGDLRFGGDRGGGFPLQERVGLIGYASAEETLATGTIAQNIACFAPVPMDRIRHAARQAGVDASIMAMPGGYGRHMSGDVCPLPRTVRHGVMLARAILPDPPLLLLDDPAPGLDASAEDHLRALLAERRSRGLTTVFATHKIAQVTMASHILVLGERGQRAFGLRDEIVSQLAKPRAPALKAVGA